MERWVEIITLSCTPYRKNMVSGEALNAIECLPVLEELNCKPLELKKALGSLAPGKAPRKDIIPSEILKCYEGDAFTELYSPLSFYKDFWDGYWGRVIQLLVHWFDLSPLTVPEVFAKVNSPQFFLISKVANENLCLCWREGREGRYHKTGETHP